MFGRKSKSHEIGLNGTAEEFRKANKRAINKKGSGYYGSYRGTEAQKELRKGALQAFHEGRPENIQIALLYSNEFKIHEGYVQNAPDVEKNPCENILSELIKGGADPLDVINLALLANTAQDKRQAVLDNSLLKAIMNEIDAGGAFIAALLNAGADANASVKGYKGFTLVRAVEKNQPLSVIEMLYKKGASFDDALESMKANGWEDKMINRVKVLREKFTGQPADEVSASVAELRKEIAQLREQLTGKNPAAPAAPDVQKKDIKKRYDHLNRFNK